MAIRKRKIREIDIPRVVEDDSAPRGFNIETGKTWKEESIEILNTLEREQKINIYDKNNYGGMYLDTSRNVNTKLKAIFSQPSTSVHSKRVKEKKSIEKKSPTNDDFKNFFK